MACAKANGNCCCPISKSEKFYGYVDDKGSGKVELYDLDSDTGETKNLADQHTKTFQCRRNDTSIASVCRVLKGGRCRHELTNERATKANP